MGLPTLKELIDRHYEKVVSQKETDAERELRLYDEMAAIGACDGMLSAMEVDQYLEPVMDAIDSHYGKFKEHLTPKERARIYRHYVLKVIVKDQEHLNWHRAEYPIRFKFIDRIVETQRELQDWCAENVVKGWGFCRLFGHLEMGFKDEVEATGFYLVFGGSKVEKA